MTLDGFLPYVLPEVIGCPDPTARAAVLSAAAEFCRQTRAWSEIQDPVPLVNNVQDYDLDMPPQSYALTVISIHIGSRKLTPVSMDQLSYSLPNWQTAIAPEPNFYNSAVERGSVRVYPIPTEVVTPFGMAMRVAYVPLLSATTLPDFLGQRYLEVIASGAKARLMVVPGQVFSNPNLGAYYQQKFDDAIVNARIEEAMDRVPGKLTVKARTFGF
jgi:hypothetical protein